MSSGLQADRSPINVARPLLKIEDSSPTSGTRVRQGDFQSMYRKHASFVLRVVCLRAGCNRQIGKELMQEVFMRVWLKRAQYRHQCNIRTWLYGFAKNVSLEHVRKESRHSIEAGAAIPEGRVPTWAQVPSSQEQRMNAQQTVQLILRQLSEPKRELLMMTDLAGMKITEAADCLGEEYDTIRKRRDAARREFVRFYKRYFGTEGPLQW